MAKEIERKFAVTGDSWRISARPVSYRQGYIPNQHCVFRIRIAGDKGYLTLKGAMQGITRSEYEYEIPLSDAVGMLDEFNTPHQVVKTRHHVEHDGFEWVVDEFEGENEGLIVAEIELEHEEQEFSRPDWVGDEISHDKRYSNFQLSQNPYSGWEI